MTRNYGLYFLNITADILLLPEWRRIRIFILRKTINEIIIFWFWLHWIRFCRQRKRIFRQPWQRKNIATSESVNLSANLYENIVLTFDPAPPEKFGKMSETIKRLFKKTEIDGASIVKEWFFRYLSSRKEEIFCLLNNFRIMKSAAELTAIVRKKTNWKGWLVYLYSIDELHKNTKEIIQEEYLNENVDELKLYNMTFSDFRYFSLIYQCEQERIIVQFKKNFILEQILKI